MLPIILRAVVCSMSYHDNASDLDVIMQVVCTRWGSDPMAYGSYSSIAVGALGGEEYDILAENLGGRVFFAGEHTTKKHPATMHGAFFSGHREVRLPVTIEEEPIAGAVLQSTLNTLPPRTLPPCMVHFLLATKALFCLP